MEDPINPLLFFGRFLDVVRMEVGRDITNYSSLNYESSGVLDSISNVTVFFIVYLMTNILLL